MSVPAFVAYSLITLAFPASTIIYALLVTILFTEFLLKEIPRLI
jgi:hypothetical protein